MTSDWFDVSIPLHTGMVHWPGDPGVEITRVEDMNRGDEINLTHLSMGAHVGTHMDAPLHYLADGTAIDGMPIEATVGPARVIFIDHPKLVTRDELLRHDIGEGERILIRTRNSPRCWEAEDFVNDFVYLETEAARHLAQRRVRAVGVDYLSVGGMDADGSEVHRILLDAGVWIIEGLNLAAVEPGRYELLCLPLRIVGADGAPARAVLRRTG